MKILGKLGWSQGGPMGGQFGIISTGGYTGRLVARAGKG